MRHRGSETLHRHLHERPFAAIVLAGGYVEAGDTGRHCVTAGDVIVHRAFERHLDRFDPRGAEVLVLPLSMRWRGSVRGHIPDPDAVARLAEHDPIAAQELLDREMTRQAANSHDWPDLLAADLLDAPDLSLARWAAQHGLHAASLSRGFRAVPSGRAHASRDRLLTRYHRSAFDRRGSRRVRRSSAYDAIDHAPYRPVSARAPRRTEARRRSCRPHFQLVRGSIVGQFLIAPKKGIEPRPLDDSR
jgi:hypothetical protein